MCKQSVAEHSIIEEKMGWGNKALKGAFIHSLSEQPKDQLATKDEPETFDDAMKLAVQIDNCFQERPKEKIYRSHEQSYSVFHLFLVYSAVQPTSLSNSEPESEPKLGSNCLPQEEQQ